MISKSEPYDETKNKVIKERVELKRLNNGLKPIKKNGFNIIDNHEVVLSKIELCICVICPKGRRKSLILSGLTMLISIRRSLRVTVTNF